MSNDRLTADAVMDALLRAISPIAVVFTPMALDDTMSGLEPQAWPPHGDPSREPVSFMGVPAFVCKSEVYGAYVFSDPNQLANYRRNHKIEPVRREILVVGRDVEAEG